MDVGAAFVINLPRDHVRLRRFMADVPPALGMSFQVWTAFDGRREDARSVAADWMCANRMTCTAGLVGCYVSHVALWRHLADAPRSWVLVTEDDASVATADARDRIRRAAADADAVGADVVNLADPLCNEGDRFELRPTPVFVTTCAYLVSERGVRRLIDAFDHPIHYHVDATVSWHVMRGHVVAYRACPSVFRQADSVSTISASTFPAALPHAFGPTLRPIVSSAAFGILGAYFNVTIVAYVVLALALPAGLKIPVILTCFALETTTWIVGRHVP